jgi:hypothetical protein
MSILIEFSDDDQASFSLNPALAVSRATSFISLGQGFVADMSGNDIFTSAITPLTAGGYFADNIPASLLDFDLDLNLKTITLTFDDVVRASSLVGQGITLQSSPLADLTNTASFVTLTGGVTTSPNGFVVLVYIVEADFHEIKKRTGLAVSRESTYLSLDSLVMLDVQAQPVNAIIPPNAIQVQRFTQDAKRPSVVAVDIDMNLHLVSIFFDEVMAPASVNPADLELEGTTLNKVSLLTSTVLETLPSLSVTIQLSFQDQTSIKADDTLCTVETNCNLNIASPNITDITGNTLKDAFVATLQAPRTFTADGTAPALDIFDINMSNDTLTLYFPYLVRT